MAESTSVAVAATPIPSSADIKRAEKLARERFLHAGEAPAVALAPGTPRRNALDRALIECESGAKRPSTQWRRQFSLLLGLERLLSEDTPKLVDGTVLSAHQVDALSGTLAALLADAQRLTASASDGREPESGDAGQLTDGHRSANGADATPDGKALATMISAVEQSEAGDVEDADVEDIDDEYEDADDADEDEDEDADEDDDDDLDDDDDVDEDDDDLDDADEDQDEDEVDQEPDASQDEDEEADADEEPQDWQEEDEADQALEDGQEDPNAHKRFWFEHATGAGKTVAALGFVEASQTGGVLILTHRRNLVDQFIGELKDRGYSKRISRPLYVGEDVANGPVTVETYQWFVRNAGRISSSYVIVICDEAHTALGEKTSTTIREWTGPIFVGMTATGALIARHVTDLFPTQTSRFDLAQAARRGVIVPLRCVRIPPGVGVRTIAKVPLRRGEVDTEFDQEELAQLLDQHPFNLAAANLYKTRFGGIPGVVYTAGVKHAFNLAEAFRAEGIKAQAVSGETPKRELAQILAKYEKGDVDVLINAQLLAEGWNSPRATLCMHLAPTASKRIYQQRVGRVTRRHPGKEAGIVVDFVHPATRHDDPVVTLHSLLDRDVYRGGAIVVGPVRRGRGRRMRVERRVVPVSADRDRRIEVLERELWRIAVENLDSEERYGWAALAGAKVAVGGWRKARAMMHFDRSGELKSTFLLNAAQRNKSAQIRIRALTDIMALKDADAVDRAVDLIAAWPKDERKEGVKVILRALAEKRIGRRDQSCAWTWRLAEYTREVHEEYAVQRWPETKRLLGLLVNSAGVAHVRNARRLVQATRKQDRRLAAALLAAALAHTPEAEEVLRGGRTRMSRKPQGLARELLRNFPKRRGKASRRKRRKAAATTPAQSRTSAPAKRGSRRARSAAQPAEQTTKSAVSAAEPAAEPETKPEVSAAEPAAEPKTKPTPSAATPSRPAADPSQPASEPSLSMEPAGQAAPASKALAPEADAAATPRKQRSKPAATKSAAKPASAKPKTAKSTTAKSTPAKSRTAAKPKASAKPKSVKQAAAKRAAAAAPAPHSEQMHLA